MAQDGPTTFQSVYIIGIGGSGMSGIALILHEKGLDVTGSDLKESLYVRQLRDAGVKVNIGHDPQNIDRVNPDVVVISTAVYENNPELMRARELGITVWHRARMYTELCKGVTTIAVSGTHGKTTTSSMVTSMLNLMGHDPSFLIGGVVEGYGTSGHYGGGGYFVAEADESDKSFLMIDPDIAVVTNIEEDHLDHYENMDHVYAAFQEFMGLVGDKGTVLVMGDVPFYVELAKATGRRVFTYGFEDTNDYVCTGYESHGLSSTFEAKLPSGQVVHSGVQVNPGPHNVLNALATIAVADVLGFDPEQSAAAVAEFKGVKRRFTKVGEYAGITVVDDYGHHPTEIEVTLRAASELDYGRVVSVFQPLRYTRTALMGDKFAESFKNADAVYVMDVWGACEIPIPGISGKTIANIIRPVDGKPGEVHYIPNRRKLIDRLVKDLVPGDLVITQGGGDVTLMGPALLAALEDRDGRNG